MVQRKAKERSWQLVRWNEWRGLALLLLGATSIGLGLYFAVWFALRPFYHRSMTYAVQGAEWLVFPLFLGLGGILWASGRIELCDLEPSYREGRWSTLLLAELVTLVLLIGGTVSWFLN